MYTVDVFFYDGGSLCSNTSVGYESDEDYHMSVSSLDRSYDTEWYFNNPIFSTDFVNYVNQNLGFKGVSN